MANTMSIGVRLESKTRTLTKSSDELPFSSVTVSKNVSVVFRFTSGAINVGILVSLLVKEIFLLDPTRFHKYLITSPSGSKLLCHLKELWCARKLHGAVLPQLPEDDG